MQTTEFEHLAERLRRARLSGEPVTAPIKAWSTLDADSGFRSPADQPQCGPAVLGEGYRDGEGAGLARSSGESLLMTRHPFAPPSARRPVAVRRVAEL